MKLIRVHGLRFKVTYNWYTVNLVDKVWVFTPDGHSSIFKVHPTWFYKSQPWIRMILVPSLQEYL